MDSTTYTPNQQDDWSDAQASRIDMLTGDEARAILKTFVRRFAITANSRGDWADEVAYQTAGRITPGRW